MASLRKFTKRLSLLLNIAVGFLFLLSCCNAFLHPDRWWFVSLLAFFFPLLLILLIGFLIFWIFVCARYALISGICLLIGWQNIHAFFGFNPAGHDFSHKDSTAIRIMTWNVRSWDEFTTRKTGASDHRQLMMNLIASQNADILCFQEFYEPADSTKSNIRYISKELKFPYLFFSRDYYNHSNKSQNGVIIFSKYPIKATSQKHFTRENGTSAESIISADINIRGKMIRVFTTHLQSVLFKRKDFRNVEIIRNAEDSMLEASRSIVKKLKSALSLRGYQADTVRNLLDRSPYPQFICGDFNDVPNSYTYFHIRGDRQDAFIAKCFGIGRSYVNISPTLRIDYILPSMEFKILQTMKLTAPYSDHHALLTDLQLSDNQ